MFNALKRWVNAQCLISSHPLDLPLGSNAKVNNLCNFAHDTRRIRAGGIKRVKANNETKFLKNLRIHIAFEFG